MSRAIILLGVLQGCFQNDCPEGFLRDNGGNCIQVEADTDVDTDSDSDVDLLLNVETTCSDNGNTVPFRTDLKVYSVNTETLVVDESTDSSGEFCEGGVSEGGNYRIEIYDTAAQSCIMWLTDVNLSSNPEWFDQDSCDAEAATAHIGDCEDMDYIYDCWGSPEDLHVYGDLTLEGQPAEDWRILVHDGSSTGFSTEVVTDSTGRFDLYLISENLTEDHWGYNDYGVYYNFRIYPCCYWQHEETSEGSWDDAYSTDLEYTHAPGFYTLEPGEYRIDIDIFSD